MNPYLPREAEVVGRTAESTDTFTLQLRLTDGAPYDFAPGQFNMLYLYGGGEVPISIVADDPETGLLTHTVRALGRITQGLSRLRPGDRVGLRGPFGHGWPLEAAEGKDIVIVTGGLGCAPSVSIIHHVLAHRETYGRLNILQGVKHTDDLIWRSQYDAWAALPDVEVHLAADEAEPGWEGHVTLEISNTTPLPAKVYANEGVAQMLFFESDEVCATSYLDRGGKYQGQRGVTLPKT